MALSRLLFVTCDRCGRPAGTDEDMQDTGVAARRAARRLGFTIHDGCDLCPGCALAARTPAQPEKE